MRWELVPTVYLCMLYWFKQQRKCTLSHPFRRSAASFPPITGRVFAGCWIAHSFEGRGLCSCCLKLCLWTLLVLLSIEGVKKIWCFCSDAFWAHHQTLAVSPLLFLKAPENFASGNISEYDCIVVSVDPHYSFVSFQHTACLQLRVWFCFSLPHVSVHKLEGTFL